MSKQILEAVKMLQNQHEDQRQCSVRYIGWDIFEVCFYGREGEANRYVYLNKSNNN